MGGQGAAWGPRGVGCMFTIGWVRVAMEDAAEGAGCGFTGGPKVGAEGGADD